MMRCIAALLIAGCLTIPVWAQAPQAQTPSEPAASPGQPAGEKSADQMHPAEQASSDAQAPATETTEYPLDKFPNFSAIVSGGPVPGSVDDKHIYRSGKLLRVQGDAPRGNYFLTDLSARITHGVDTHGCLKISTPNVRSFPFFLSAPGVKYEVSAAGEETVDGHQCRVEDLKIHDPKNPIVLNFRLYEAEDLQGFPIEIKNLREHAYHWVIRYKDVRVGPQDPTLFMVPDKCDSADDFKKPGPVAKPKSAPSTKPQ
jgi:hypothetical protein